jgi:GcrA cell cycle regulator
MEWNDELIGRLIALWAEGHSTAEIGRRLNVTKNAVVGKAHRLDLPARPSPIRRDGPRLSSRPTAPRRVTGPTLPPLATTLTPGLVPSAPHPAAPLAAAVLPAAARQPAPEPAAAIKPPAPRVVSGYIPRPMACCWPIGEPGTKSFHFCEAEAVPGKPYCSSHAQIAYVKVRDRREEAA